MDTTEDSALAEDAKMEKCQQYVERFYDRFRDNMLKVNIPFSGEPLANGSPPAFSAGATLLPSRIEMRDLGALISLALNYWVEYGQLPTVGQMRSSAESTESDSVVYITTLYSLVLGGAFLTSVCGGNLDKAVSVLSLSTEKEEPPTTSQNTPSRTPVPIKTGPSTPPTVSPGGQSTPTPETPGERKPAGSSTRKKSKAKKGSPRKSKRKPRLSQRTTK